MMREITMALQSRSSSFNPCLPQFAHIKRYHDPVNKCVAAKLLPGEYYVTMHEEMVTTVLGSCISACIYDPEQGIGGMNHFMLPESNDAHGAMTSRSGVSDLATRYGFFAMEGLINDILKLGCRKSDLRAKVFGGGKIIQGMTNIGQQNIGFAKDYLRTEGIPTESSDVGLIYPRKVNFFPKTGRALVKRLTALHNDTIVTRELSYRAVLSKSEVTGEVELF
jgi:chemotaxis protein CheD